MVNAVDVAAWFVITSDYTKTHRQVQKLAYIAHGYMLAIKNEPLFTDEILALENGVFIPSIWKKFKKHGHAPIEKITSNAKFTDDQVKILRGTYMNYAHLCGYYLSEMTAKNPNLPTPCQQCYMKGKKNEIPNDITQKYYADVVQGMKNELYPGMDAEMKNERETQPDTDDDVFEDLFKTVTEEMKNDAVKETKNTQEEDKVKNETDADKILNAENAFEMFNLQKDITCTEIKARFRELVLLYDSSRGRINKSEVDRKKADEIMVKIHETYANFNAVYGCK